MTYDNPWLYDNVIFDGLDIDGYVAFVYLITNRITGRKYIGKKNLHKTRTKKAVGKRNKKIKSDSDWRTYYGSNQELIDDVEKYGKDHFGREILHLCRTKSEASYLEAKLQFEHGVLFSDDYYNSWIMCRVHKKHMKAIKKS